MSSKQDRPAVRTASELERKLRSKKTFKEHLGMINDTRDKVDSVENKLSDELEERITILARDTERILMSALESYVENGEYEEYKKTVSTQFQIFSDEVLMTFSEVTNEIHSVDGDLQSKYDEIKSYISFSGGSITLGSSENAITLTIENDAIVFKKNGIEFGTWDGDNFYTGNIVVRVTERAQLGNFAFVPRSNGNLSFLKVGG